MSQAVCGTTTIQLVTLGGKVLVHAIFVSTCPADSSTRSYKIRKLALYNENTMRGGGGKLVDRLPLMDLNGHARVIVCGKGHRPLHSQIISTTLLAMLRVIGELRWPFSDGVSYTPPLQKAKKQGEMTIPSHPHSHPISKFYFS